jgi:hypothetical protein
MDTKLTLKLDQEVIERAKQYAANNKMSLSYLVENYLNSLTSDKSGLKEISISPFVKSLSSPTGLPTDYNYKKERGDYLEQKYK